MRRRLRDPLAPSDYQVVRDNRVWKDHMARVAVTAAAIAWMEPESVIDPACGDASIVSAAHRLSPIKSAHLGDISKPQIDGLRNRRWEFLTTLHEGDALMTILSVERADLCVLTEVLEHVEDPEALLRAAYARTDHLVASSPLDEQPEVGNHEHVWAWDKDGYREMLESCGWKPRSYTELSFHVPGWPYAFQVWVCERSR